MDLEEIAKKVSDFDERFRRVEDDLTVLLEDVTDSDKARMSRAQFLEFLDWCAESQYGRLFSELRGFVIPGLIDTYAGASEEDRRALLSELAQARRLRIALWEMLDERAWLLAKAPLEEKAGELRTLLLVAILQEVDLDVYPTAMILHGKSAREILRDFEPYDYGASGGRQ